MGILLHHLVAFALLLHVLFWGAGAAMLLMPRPWARFWPVLVLPAGFALQSAVVWAGAYAGLSGTNMYAHASLALPAALLGWALWRHHPRAAWTDVTRIGLVWAATAACLVLLVLPVAIASRGLTTISMGSCDAADYAAGARVLMEFARGDRAGFIGLVEVVQVHSVDNFFDYWLRLNHFTPAALLALNGSILHCAPHELATLLTAVLLAAAVPVVFWTSRVLFRYNGGASLVIASLFGISPVMWYAVAHVSPGQLLAAPAIALLTWSGIALWRGRMTWRCAGMFMGVQAIAYWLILGSYNFIIIVGLVPVIAYALGLALWRRQWRRFGKWVLMMAVPLVACSLVFAPRVAGLAERFMLLQAYDFGWQIPALTAEGWLGMVQGPDLQAWTFAGLRWLLSALVVGMLVWAYIRAGQQGRRAAWVALSVSVPILVGYLFLQARGARLGTNASYDAYKLFAVFYPLLLPAFCWWVTLRRSGRLHEWLLVVGVAIIVTGFNLVGCGMFVWKLSRPPLIVDGELRQLRQVEAMADVKSVNLLVPDMWSRLWAHVFLLRKEQYFLTHTYEGRLNTALRGDWDLEGGRVAVMLPEGARRQITSRFALVDTRHPAFVRALPTEGWHQEESVPSARDYWRWTTEKAVIEVDNPHPYPLRVEPTLDGWSPLPRTVALTNDGVALAVEPGATLAVRKERESGRLAPVVIPPGKSTLQLRTPEPLYQTPDDPRPLGTAVFRLTLEPQPVRP